MKTFIPGQIASAADVNANFAELVTKDTALKTDITNLAKAPNLAFTSDPNFTSVVKSIHAMGPLRIMTLTIARKSAGGYQSGYHWRVGTVGTASERPKVKHFGTIMGKSDPYLYIEPNGEIHMQFWSSGTWPNSTWDAQIVWAVI